MEVEKDLEMGWSIKLSANDWETAHKQILFLAEWGFMHTLKTLDIKDKDFHLLLEKIK